MDTRPTLQLTVPHLRKTAGNIINISSLSGYFGQAGSSTYCATKGGLVAMTKSIAIDEAAHDVRANAVSPGNVWTPLWEEHVQGPTAEADIAGGRDCQLLGRYGTLIEVGEVCLHLATAGFTTGHEYLMTGGAELGYSRKTRKGDGTAKFG
jgi:NAD(P)-dependent dehydrogenase (short-subunit alcohol dehydrogenase family)